MYEALRQNGTQMRVFQLRWIPTARIRVDSSYALRQFKKAPCGGFGCLLLVLLFIVTARQPGSELPQAGGVVGDDGGGGGDGGGDEGSRVNVGDGGRGSNGSGGVSMLSAASQACCTPSFPVFGCSPPRGDGVSHAPRDRLCETGVDAKASGGVVGAGVVSGICASNGVWLASVDSMLHLARPARLAGVVDGLSVGVLQVVAVVFCGCWRSSRWVMSSGVHSTFTFSSRVARRWPPSPDGSPHGVSSFAVSRWLLSTSWAYNIHYGSFVKRNDLCQLLPSNLPIETTPRTNEAHEMTLV